MKLPFWEILQEYKENQDSLSKIMLKNWDLLRKENKDFRKEEIAHNVKSLHTLPEMPLGHDSNQNTKFDKWHDLDLRILDVMIKGVKGIPYDRVYGLNLTYPDTASPVSLIIMGWNGGGKSSIYNSLELIFKNESSVEVKHKINAENRRNFFHHFGSSQPVSITVRSVSDIFFEYKEDAINKVSDHLDLNPFFCSESDIALFECSGHKMGKYLDELVGLSELVEVKSVLESLLEDYENDYKKITLESEEDNKHKVRLTSLITQVRLMREKCDGKLTSIRNEILSDAQDVLTSLVEEYIEEDEEIELHYLRGEGEKRIFTGLLKKKDTDILIEPRHYFNNFRLKLYFLSLRIAVAFNTMRTSNISFPLIFDDIFDSSDFKNRIKTSEFFQKVVETYYSKSIHQRPLQLIFFTQDEVVGKSAYEGIIKSGHQGKVCLVRLFDPLECDDKDEISRELKNTNIEEGDDNRMECDQIMATPKEYLFYNLYDVISSK